MYVCGAVASRLRKTEGTLYRTASHNHNMYMGALQCERSFSPGAMRFGFEFMEELA